MQSSTAVDHCQSEWRIKVIKATLWQKYKLQIMIMESHMAIYFCYFQRQSAYAYGRSRCTTFDYVGHTFFILISLFSVQWAKQPTPAGFWFTSVRLAVSQTCKKIKYRTILEKKKKFIGWWIDAKYGDLYKIKLCVTQWLRVVGRNQILAISWIQNCTSCDDRLHCV